MPLVERAPAKINLGLHVLRKRSDGYHDVETVLHRIDWADTITAQPAGRLSMTCSDPSLPTDDRNLCLQAAQRLADVCSVTSGAALHLEKRVPYGAGLGGGSSDAAATLRLLSRLWNVNPTPETLRRIAQSLGADVPFFLTDAPAAYATGRGDKVTPLYDSDVPYRLSFPVLVFVPPIQISTPDAYAEVTPRQKNRPSLPVLIQSDDLAEWRSVLTNDFEEPLARQYEAISETRSWLQNQGASYVSLSGSGSALFGIFETLDAAEAAMNAAHDRAGDVYVMDPSTPLQTAET